MRFIPKLERSILVALTKRSEPLGWVSDFSIPGYDPEIVSRHVKLAAQKGLIEAQDLSSNDGFEWAPKCLTPAGYAALKETKSARVLDLGGKLFWQISTAVLTAVVIAMVLAQFEIGR